MNKIELRKGDCIQLMKDIENKSIKCIITSPPYNLGKNHHTGKKYHSPYRDDMREQDYQDWQLKVFDEFNRILTDDGHIFYNHKNRIKNGIMISPYEWLLKTSFIIKQEIVWINRSQNFDKIRFYPWTERIYWLSKYPKNKINNVLNKYDVFDWNDWKPVGTKGNHTRAFPVKMVEDLLKVSTNENDLVLDCFAGSGTTGVACQNLNRNCIMIEKEEEYCEIINKRLKENKSLKDYTLK